MKTFYSMEGTFYFLADCYACGMGTEMFWKEPGFTREGKYHTNHTAIYISARFSLSRYRSQVTELTADVVCRCWEQEYEILMKKIRITKSAT